jgi:hypothetical protein
MRKSKIMIFNSRKNLHVFKIGNNIIEQTNCTSYLGFKLTPSGKFTSTIKYLYDKACKAYFLMRTKYKILPELCAKTKVKLFDTMIVPILLYGSEVWGAYCVTPKNSKQKFEHYLQDCGNLIEKLHSQFCKQTLMVSKRSCNVAVRMELGRLPLFVNIICITLKYYCNIVDRDETSMCSEY